MRGLFSPEPAPGWCCGVDHALLAYVVAALTAAALLLVLLIVVWARLELLEWRASRRVVRLCAGCGGVLDSTCCTPEGT